jgi:hypothetical protein
MLDHQARSQSRERSAHLHRRAFAAERQSGTDGQQATEELNRQNDRGACWLDLASEDCFDALYAAAFGLGREPRHHQTRHNCAKRSKRYWCQPSEIGPGMRPNYQCVAQIVGFAQQETEGAAHSADHQPGKKGAYCDSHCAVIQNCSGILSAPQHEADLMTHGGDARPPSVPLSKKR